MKTIKHKIYLIMIAVGITLSACQEDTFLNTTPKDALSPDIFWQTPKDIELAITGCYRGFELGAQLLFRDCGSDNGYNNFPWDGWQYIGNGQMSESAPGRSFYNYTIINRCNEFIANVSNVKFLDEKEQKSYLGQARFLRAYRYFLMTTAYGAVPIVTEVFDHPDESKVPRNSKEEVERFIEDELKEVLSMVPASYGDKQFGRITQGAAQALLMRLYLHKGDFAGALKMAESIEGYELFPSYEGLFDPENEKNKEVILSAIYVEDHYKIYFVPHLPNGTGGWSSAVPTQQLVDSYEMISGLTIEEAKASGAYDEANPFKDRDPRLRATVIYPGQIWRGKPFRSIEEGDNDHYKKADNSSKTGYNFRKYQNHYGKNVSANAWNSGADIYIFRYAEVLLTIAEAENEVNGPTTKAYEALDKVRLRAGMPAVDRTKYASKESLRTLIRNERRVELAWEGIRRFDILRWKIAPEVLNITMTGVRQGKVLETKMANGDHEVALSGDPIFVEKRVFEEKHYLLPIPQAAMDKNPQLKPNNPGY